MTLRMATRQARRGLGFLAGALATIWQGMPARAADEQPPRMQTVEIVGMTPLPGIGLARDRIPANVQILDSAAATGPDSANLPDALNRRLSSVFVNEIQGNPFQPDISIRGFTASPLLG